MIVLSLAIGIYLNSRLTSSDTVPEIAQVRPAQFAPALLTELYSDLKYNFSFRYPAGYTATTFPDPQNESAYMIVVQKIAEPTSSSTKPVISPGFQMRVAPIDEDISVLTVERIRQDLPDLVINNPQEVILGDAAAAGKGVAFTGDDPAFGGASREVWFIFNHNLYQIRTYAVYDPLVQAVLSSWEFR